MRIKNFEQLATTPLRKQALLIAEAGLDAVDTARVIERILQYERLEDRLTVDGVDYDLKTFKRTIIIGFGKAAFTAVEAIQEKLGARITCGFVIDIKGGDLGTEISCRIGTHPLPTMVNVQATQELIDLLSSCTEDDLVMCVVSGGGSSLLGMPHEMTCEAESIIIKQLTKLGANIQELNTVRKHISKVKGGQLAKICYPATMVNIIFSDVPDGDISMVASGPTVLDTTTMHDAAEILKQYTILDLCQLPSCSLIETPKDSKYFEKVNNVLAVSSDMLLRACREKGRDLGFTVRTFSTGFQGEAASLGREFLAATSTGTCLLAVGESTVHVRGKGKGGRNQEMALAALALLNEGQVLLALATDGADNTEVAGAMVDVQTQRRAKSLGLDAGQYVADNNSYTFFQEVGDYIDTGITGTNVADLVICLRE